MPHLPEAVIFRADKAVEGAYGTNAKSLNVRYCAAVAVIVDVTQNIV
jgi:hypothetical protein